MILPPRTLTIAGSDSGGGAGIQADLKAFSALGCYGMTVITAVTAQNTRNVTAIHPVPPSVIRDQLEAVLSDLGVDAVKIGMLHSSEVIEAVARVLRAYQPKHVVIDPVMVAKSGDHLLRKDAVEAMKEELIPLASLITPNLPEAEVLTGFPVTNKAEMAEAGKLLLTKGTRAVLVKGGHMKEVTQTPDFLIYHEDGDYGKAGSGSKENSGPLIKERWFEALRIESRNNHGTGCTLSSAITAGLARGLTLEEATENGLQYLREGLAASLNWSLGGGHGPVHHFHRWWKA